MPVATDPNEVGLYTTGTYLMAGLEVADLNGAQKSLPLAEPARDAPAVIAATTPTPPPPSPSSARPRSSAAPSPRTRALSL